MTFNKKLSDLIDPIISAKTDDWQELAVLTKLSGAELEESLTMVSEEDRPTLRSHLNEYQVEIRRTVQECFRKLKAYDNLLPKEDELCEYLWSSRVLPSSEIRKEVAQFLASRALGSLPEDIIEKQLTCNETQAVVLRYMDNHNVTRTVEKIGTALGMLSAPVRSSKTKQKFDIAKIWEQFHKTRSDDSRNQLMKHYMYLVKYTAERLYSKLPDKVELDDLISAGVFGLMDAIDAFDPDRGVKFETYCSPRIRGSILDELRSMDWVPRLVRARAHQLAKARQSLETHLGRKPTAKETAKELDMDMQEFDRLQRDANAVSLVSLNTKYNESDRDKDICEIDEIIKDRNTLVEAQKRDLKNLLTKGLTRAERLIIVLYYYEEMTMKQIGETLDLSESRVSQMRSSVVARLKAHMNTRKKKFSTTLDNL